MTQTRLEPAASIISKFGGPERVSEITGKHVSRIYRWMYAKAKGGTGGAIPHGDAQKLLRFAGENGIELSSAEFFFAPAEAAQ